MKTTSPEQTIDAKLLDEVGKPSKAKFLVTTTTTVFIQIEADLLSFQIQISLGFYQSQSGLHKK